jgi:stearoyl-CoA desaturase (delta-9 desaturase)
VPAVLEAVLIGLLTSQVAFIATTVYLHRTLAHRAITLKPFPTLVCRYIIWIATGTRPRQWVAVHRKHHAHTDKDGDPHSPVVFGFSLVQFGNAILYRRVARNPAEVARYARDLPGDRWDAILFDHAVLGLGIGIGALIAVFGWEIGLIAAVVHASVYLLGGGAINAIGHKWGKRPHDNLATNNRWLALFVAGEGLHNNHHAASTSGRLSMAKGELDPGWWAIRVLVLLRWAAVRHEKPMRTLATESAVSP